MERQASVLAQQRHQRLMKERQAVVLAQQRHQKQEEAQPLLLISYQSKRRIQLRRIRKLAQKLLFGGTSHTKYNISYMLFNLQ